TLFSSYTPRPHPALPPFPTRRSSDLLFVHLRHGRAEQQHSLRRPESRYHRQGDRAAEAAQVGRPEPVRGRPASEGGGGGGGGGGASRAGAGTSGAIGAAPARRISAREIAALTNGELTGPADVTVSGVAPRDRAAPDD